MTASATSSHTGSLKMYLHPPRHREGRPPTLYPPRVATGHQGVRARPAARHRGTSFNLLPACGLDARSQRVGPLQVGLTSAGKSSLLVNTTRPQPVSDNPDTAMYPAHDSPREAPWMRNWNSQERVIGHKIFPVRDNVCTRRPFRCQIKKAAADAAPCSAGLRFINSEHHSNEKVPDSRPSVFLSREPGIHIHPHSCGPACAQVFAIPEDIDAVRVCQHRREPPSPPKAYTHGAMINRWRSNTSRAPPIRHVITCAVLCSGWWGQHSKSRGGPHSQEKVKFSSNEICAEVVAHSRPVRDVK